MPGGTFVAADLTTFCCLDGLGLEMTGQCLEPGRAVLVVLVVQHLTLHTGEELLTDRQRERLMVLSTDDDHVQVEATWGTLQQMIAAYSSPDRTSGRAAMAAVIDTLREGIPAALVELRRLGWTLNHRAADVLAYFEQPGTSNGPTETLNGRLEHLRGLALGFRNLTNYIACCLLETGGFRTHSALG